MKKILIAFLALVTALSCFAFIGCENKVGEVQKNEDKQATLDMYIFDKDGQTISEDFVLPGKIGKYDATWTSNNAIIALEELAGDEANGIERQYVAKVGLPEERTEISLTVALSEEVTKSFTVYVNSLSVYDFSGSYNFIQNNGTVFTSFALDTTCEYKDHTATITWSVDEEYADYLEISEDGKECIVYPSSLNPKVRINATFTYKGESTTKSYRMTVSEQKEPLQEVDYWYTNTGVGIVMSGYVVSIATVYSESYGNVSLYMVNDEFTAGYYLYRVKADSQNAALLAPGVHITVTGTTNTDYNGLMETNAGGTLVVDADVPAINVNEKVYAVDNDIIGGLQSAYYNQSRLVSLTNWKVKEIKSTPDLSSGTQTLFVLTKAGVDVPVVISKYQEGAYAYSTDDATCAALIALQGTVKVGDILSVTGILGNYKGHQIAPLSAEAIVVGGTADADNTVYAGQKAAKAVAAIDKLIADNGLASIVAVAKNVQLPATVEGCEVAFRVIGEPRSISIANGALVINPGKMERACLTAVITVDGFTTNIFRYIDAADLDDAGKVELEMGELTVNGGELHITENSTITLPVVGNLFNNVTISWASNNECAVVNGSKLVITLPKEATTIILTATITSGSVSETVEFELAIDAATADLFVGKFVSDVKAGTAYKFGFVQGTLGKTLYLTGVVSGRYLETTEKAELAVDVYVESAENGNKIYILDGETKKYLDVYFNADSKLSLQFNAEGACVFAYNATVNAWVTNVDGTDYYVGTYSNFATMSASKLSYISAENTGVSQFPGNFAVLAPAALKSTAVADVKAGTAYKFGFVQGTLGKTLYLTGVVSGRYLETTEKAELAVDVYVESAENGNKIYILDGETKKYLDVYFNADSKLSLQFNAEGACVFAYNATVNAWVTNVDGTDYYVGTYSNFATMSASKLSYISAENTGVSQFPGNFFVQEVKEVGPVAKSEPVEGVAYKFSLVQGTLGQTLYLTGVVSGRYLETTDKISKAVDVFVEKADGGYKIYILDGEAKKYLDVYFNADSKLSLQFNAEGTCVFAYNATVNAWVTNVDGTDYYVGTYSNFATMSASKLSYINAENTGVSQFPANIVAIEFVEEGEVTPPVECEHEWVDATCTAPKTCSKCGETEGEALGHTYVEGVCSVCGAADPNHGTPEVGDKYYLHVYQANNKKDLYFAGTTANTYYLGTTTDIASAVGITVEEVEGGYVLSFEVSGAKKYVCFSEGSKVNASISTSAFVFGWNETYKTFTATVAGDEYYIGTYNTFDTLSASKISYAATSFVSNLVKADGTVFEPAKTPVECEHEGGTATCKELATCSKCGEAYGELAAHAWGEALSHDAANHWVECSVCGEKKDESAHDFANGDCVCGELKPVCNHVWSDATCTEGSVCTICGEKGEEALGHDWSDATCTDPKICSICKATEGEALGHDWSDATCTAPKTCSVCKATEGEALGHKDENADYKCDVCSTVMAPEDGEFLTIEQAIALAKAAGSSYTTAKYFVTGIVTNVYNTTYGNMYIKDENGKQLCIYGLYTWDKETRYDKMSYKPVEGDELTVYGVLGTYSSNAQMKDAWMDDVVAHEHNWSDATCTAPKTCSICKATEGEALGHTGGEATCTEKAVCTRCETAYGSLADHNFVDGTCSACGEAESTGGEVEPVVNYADFSKFTKKTQYTTHTTSDKLWTATNSQIVEGGSSNNSQSGTFIVLGDSKAVVLNGKTSAKGSLTSATLTGGVSKISFSYTNVFSEANGVDITINIKVGGAVVATTKLDNNSVTQYTEYTYEWTLDSAITGDFVIEIVNNCPSNNSSKNKDRVAIWDLSWTSAN